MNDNCESCKVKDHEHEHTHAHAEGGDGCDCGHKHGKETTKLEIVRLLVGAVLFAISFFVPDGWAKGIVCGCAYLILGYKVIISAFSGKSFMDENALMLIASAGAFAIKDFSEAVAVMLFFQVGEFFQDLAVNRSRKSISSLMDIRSDTANLIVDGETVVKKCEEINVGDIILISAGEKIPLDGIVIDGSTTIDTSALTGESLPREIKAGDNILSGAININGTIKVKVTKLFGDSTVSKILELVENATSKKAPAEKFITKFSQYYTPIVVALATLVIVIPPLFFGEEWKEWIYRGLSFLVVSCPCALVISVPLSFFAGIGGASRQGILVKGANYMEVLANTNTVVFDKTGTLTKGKFAVSKIDSKLSDNEILRITASVENYSSHPIAQSIITAYGKDVDESVIKNVEELAGLGVSAKVDDTKYYVGNQKLMTKLNLNAETATEVGTIVYVAKEDEYLGYILIQDQIKEDAEEGLSQLHKIGVINTVMLTGDNKSTGEVVAKRLGIRHAFTELLPADKVSKVEELLEKQVGKEKLVFAGDGINDAPVLAMADIGIAMGGVGSDAAIEAADVVIMDDKIAKIPLAIKISKKTLQIVKQNIIISLVIKAIILVLVTLGFAEMWLAIFADVGVSLLAILNAIRCLKAPK